MPGPFERHRLLAIELGKGALDGARGLIRPTGRRSAASNGKSPRASTTSLSVASF
jgi:hypothetical protein